MIDICYTHYDLDCFIYNLLTLYHMPLAYDVVCNFWSDGTQDRLVPYLIEKKKLV